ncbi:scm-like with four MBT domains protein 1 isoform X1 [Lingula anatina]|uniref:Scm-like with four MBT domains protein 1 isoform X1 n=1 Tax=Lingula anatina TaxID=7574 RepID=A0A2R2MSG6_LINAN|nr:scm-like with four MBT domains protein 1 isoform X1 [Lingula anatina]|eukprot:XP_023933206.1 scm-like with four MBT domains protein 1 isoform X1 [Lingula anatina]
MDENQIQDLKAEPPEPPTEPPRSNGHPIADPAEPQRMPVKQLEKIAEDTSVIADRETNAPLTQVDMVPTPTGSNLIQQSTSMVVSQVSTTDNNVSKPLKLMVPEPQPIKEMVLHSPPPDFQNSVGLQAKKVDHTHASILIKSPTSTSTMKKVDFALIESSTNGDKQEAANCSKTEVEKSTSASVAAIPGGISVTDLPSIPVEYEEPEFIWEEYLEDTGASPAPPTAFKHVECSLQSGFTKGMKLEVANKCNSNTYWVASVVMTCGPLLRLRYDGYDEDSSADFWADVFTSDIHPIGWCAQNSKSLQPPEAIKNKYDNWSEFLVKTLTGARTAPNYLLDRTTGITPIDQIKQGMRLEVQHELQPKSVWVVRIIENIGGRLLLRYEGTDSATHDFWLFYLHPRLHPIGWGQENGCIFRPPAEIKGEHENYTEWSEILQSAIKEAGERQLPSDVFKDQMELREHSFQRGWKLELLHPKNHTHLCPATVVQVINNLYFIVEVDQLTEGENTTPVRLCCHADSPEIFPIRWAMWKGVTLITPKGYAKPEFDWDVYLADTNSEAAPEKCFNMEVPEHEFKRGQKLEAVNPEHPHQICCATITKIIDKLIWIHLDSSASMKANHIVDVESHDIFPVGWCESNGYTLKPPQKNFGRGRVKKVAVVQPERIVGDHCSPDDFRALTFSQIQNGDAGNGWCPKIYFNHKCFSGPYLSKGRIAELPKCVGPGPVVLVIKEVLTMLINVAYKSSRVLRELQMDHEPNPRMYQQMLKAKYKGKSYRAVVEICKTTEQIEEFCRQVCIKLECCPNLFSPHYVDENCPEHCSQLTKTKYTYYYGKKKKRKIGRPPGGHTNLENGPKKPGKRRKRKKVNLMAKKKSVVSENGDDLDMNGEGEEEEVFEADNQSVVSKESEDSVERERQMYSRQTSRQISRDPDFKPLRQKRKYTHYVAPPTDIRTRGVKLPKYTFEKRTHKKILWSEMFDGDEDVEEEVPQEEVRKKRGRKSKKDLETEMVASTLPSQKEKPYYSIKPSERLYLESNPLHWSVANVIQFIKTTDCAHLARAFKEQDIDGQALLLLSLPTLQEHMELKLGPAIKLCHHIERVKLAFFEQFV